MIGHACCNGQDLLEFGRAWSGIGEERHRHGTSRQKIVTNLMKNRHACPRFVFGLMRMGLSDAMAGSQSRFSDDRMCTLALLDLDPAFVC